MARFRRKPIIVDAYPVREEIRVGNMTIKPGFWCVTFSDTRVVLAIHDSVFRAEYEPMDLDGELLLEKSGRKGPR